MEIEKYLSTYLNITNFFTFVINCGKKQNSFKYISSDSETIFFTNLLKYL